jgi:hypothetical protein
MARTTLEIQDALLDEIKQKAAKERRTVEAIANDLLRLGLKTSRKRFRLKFVNHKAVLPPGLDVCDRNQLHDFLDGR